MILDTSFIIDLLKDESAASALAAKIEESPISITSVTVFEIFQGARDAEIPKLKEFFSQMSVLSLDYEAAERAGLIQKQLKDAGKMIDPEDFMIAAIALQYKKKLVTKNRKHFERIPELQIISY